MWDMRRAIKLGVLVWAVLLPWQVRAEAPVVVAHATVHGHDVPVYRIGELHAPDTSAGMDGFAVRVAYVLRAWTREHGVEAIGNLCRTPDGSAWGTVLLTVGAHVASPVTNACPPGMLATGVDIHSHPQRQHYRANAVDQIFLGRLPCREVTTQPDTFGPDDYGRPGYMVGRLGLHFQHGLDRVRLVRDMRLSPPVTPSDESRRIAAVASPNALPGTASHPGS
ncbi:hypothetical protein [Dyella ginsengisoli]|uniref:hypothetical protein n=1 Tax=Dyella ginsengisoli TaxID=363848 RepID=UPI00034BD7D4|nr:hypothetical protein [Dyella ginsengisoli]